MNKNLILPALPAPAASTAVERIVKASRRPANLGKVEEGVISLAMGEPDNGTSVDVVDAGIAALRAGHTRYSALTGMPELRDALAASLSEKSGRLIEAQQVVVTHGGSAGLAASILSLIEPGDKVLIPEPTYSLYADHLAMVGAQAVWVPNLPDGTLNLEKLEQEAPQARMVILCNPGNPTGRVYAAGELHALSRILEANPRLLLLADEAYSDIVFDDLPFLSSLQLHSIADQVICCSTFSKTYAMTGWRLGYVVASPEHAAAINLIHRSINGAINTFVQEAGVQALKTPAHDLKSLTDSYQSRRDIVVELLSSVPGVSLLAPQGAFYAFPKIESKLSSEQMVSHFASAGVSVRSGAEFGPSGEGHVRISFATDLQSLTAGLQRLVAAVGAIV
ncbi:aspartate aminotransferase [Arthrobacter sp. yr096]|nr:aspartate aminotransferase [Arthrobacter sp. yr096]